MTATSTRPPDPVRQAVAPRPPVRGRRVVLAAGAMSSAVPAVPVGVPKKRWMSFDDESRLALACAEGLLLPGEDRLPRWLADEVSLMWATATAGAQDYAQICVDTATYGPGRASAAAGPRSAYNGPAAAVSIGLELTGASQTLAGGVIAGLNAVADAVAMVRAGAADAVVAGGSVSTPAEPPPHGRAAGSRPWGAAAVLLRHGAGPGWTVTGVHRFRTRPSADDAEALGDVVAQLGPGFPEGTSVLVVQDACRAGGEPEGGHPPGRRAGRSLPVVPVAAEICALGAAAVPTLLAQLLSGGLGVRTKTIAVLARGAGRDAGLVLLDRRGEP